MLRKRRQRFQTFSPRAASISASSEGYFVTIDSLNNSSTRGITPGQVLGGQFLQEKGEHEDKTSGMLMLTYDPARVHGFRLLEAQCGQQCSCGALPS